MNIKGSILLRVRIAFLLVFLFSAAIVYRIVDIQFVEGGKWTKKGQDIALRFQEVKATRGNIYSDNGSLLATSLPFYRVAFDPTMAQKEDLELQIDELSRKLAGFFKDYSAKRYKNRILKGREQNRRYLQLGSREINYQERKEMSTWPIFRQGRLKGGVIFENVDKRYRPFDYLGYRTIGSINQENNGVVGLEYSYNTLLAGTDGKALFHKIAGSWRQVYSAGTIKPENGLDIQTTINVNFQDVAETALLRALQEHQADYGCIVVMEVATGEIKAISNLSKNKKGKYSERYNYAVGSQGSREPGSTFKLASMIALLEDTRLSLDDTIDTGNGRYKVYNEVMKDHKPGGYGVLTVEEVFEKSSNIGVAKLVARHFGNRPEEYIEYLDGMGLTRPLGFQLKGEGVPYIKTTEDSTWSGLTLQWMAHGYEMKMTPLHMLSLYNAVANDGKMIQPVLVKTASKVDQVVERYNPKVIDKKICSESTLKKVRQMLEGVVENGTASNIKGGPFRIAGKTGTAKKFVNGRYTNQYYASFVGYFPAESPKYSAIVVIDNPKGVKIYGSDVAAPVFKEVADYIFAMDLNLHQFYAAEAPTEGIFPVIRAGYVDDLQLICDELEIKNYKNAELDWVKTRIEGDKIAWEDHPSTEELIPDLGGMTLRDAIYLMENRGYRVKAIGSGRVISQSISPGKKLSAGSEIVIELG